MYYQLLKYSFIFSMFYICYLYYYKSDLVYNKPNLIKSSIVKKTIYPLKIVSCNIRGIPYMNEKNYKVHRILCFRRFL